MPTVKTSASRVRENRMHGSMGGERKPGDSRQRRATPGASRLPDHFYPVPAIWLPDPSIRRERELARFGLRLVRHRTTLKNRNLATLITFGHPCLVSELFGH